MTVSDDDIQRFLDEPSRNAPVDIVDARSFPPWFLVGLTAFCFGWGLAFVVVAVVLGARVFRKMTAEN